MKGRRTSLALLHYSKRRGRRWLDIVKQRQREWHPPQVQTMLYGNVLGGCNGLIGRYCSFIHPPYLPFCCYYLLHFPAILVSNLFHVLEVWQQQAKREKLLCTQTTTTVKGFKMHSALTFFSFIYEPVWQRCIFGIFF